MNRLFLSTLCLFLVIFSCKNTQDNNLNDLDTDSQEITGKDIEKIAYIEFLLDEKTKEHTDAWTDYIQFQEVIDNLKTADLIFFKDNKETINIMFADLKLNIPESLNSSAIMARINAFETKFLKLESLCNLSTSSKQELLKNIKDVLVAFSNLTLQMNKKIEFDNQNIQKP